MTHQFLVDTFRLAIWLVLLVAVFVPLERLCALHPAKIWRKEIGVDLAWYFINSLLPGIVLSVPLALLAHVLHGCFPGYYAAVAAWPLWLKAILMLILIDLGAYWGHRALHAHPVLWRFHAIHHSPEHLDWLVNTRAHPFDIVFIRFSGLAPVYLAGLAQAGGHAIDPTVAAVMIFGTIWNFFLHANIRLRLGPLEWIICTPAFHHWHHTNDEHRDRNFSFVFPVIDRIFGTAWLPKHWPPVYGVDAKIPSTLAGQFFGPMEPEPRPASPSPAPPKTPAAENVSAETSPAKDSPTGI